MVFKSEGDQEGVVLGNCCQINYTSITLAASRTCKAHQDHHLPCTCTLGDSFVPHHCTELKYIGRVP